MMLYVGESVERTIRRLEWYSKNNALESIFTCCTAIPTYPLSPAGLHPAIINALYYFTFSAPRQKKNKKQKTKPPPGGTRSTSIMTS